MFLEEEIIRNILDLLSSIYLNKFILPFIGVGGGIEAQEYVDITSTLKNTILFVTLVGTLFGLGLSLTAKKFHVKIDPRIEQIKNVLANAHCGACGYAGCEQYAEAVLKNPEVPPNLCIPGGMKTAEAVASITGKKVTMIEPEIARIMCQGSWDKSEKSFFYEGVKDCRAVILIGGDKACKYGCLGYGTCSKICPFNAITMTEEHLPYIDPEKCTGCKKCETVCPTKVIEVLPTNKKILVLCHSKDKGLDTKKKCQTGCISCRICEKTCPFEAINVEDNLSRINLDKCVQCGLCVMKCPTNAIKDFQIERNKAFINERCNGCHICAQVCPFDAAFGEKGKIHNINGFKCTGCGICSIFCPENAIDIM
jgi:RnfABCDGE-type electron transport complex B subunit